MKKPLALLLAMTVLGFPLSAEEKGDKKEAERLENCGTVIKEIMDIPDDIPQDLIDKAECIIVYPSVLKAAFIVGGSYGRGAMTCRSGQHFTENPRPRCRGGKVGHETRMIPVGHGRYDHALEILKQFVHGLTGFRARRRQLGGELAGFERRQDRIIAGMFKIAGNPIHYLMSVLAEFFSVHGISLF